MPNPGWKVVLTQRVPELTRTAVPPMFEDLVASIPELVDLGKFKASDFDWALHPGGATIMSGVEKVMKLTPQHLRASYETYIAHGNSSSATFFSVLDKLLQGETAPYIIGCAFGPGIAVEMVAFKRVVDSRPPSENDSPAETLVAEDVD
jgi:fungal type III polyketide synthase